MLRKTWLLLLLLWLLARPAAPSRHYHEAALLRSQAVASRQQLQQQPMREAQPAQHQRMTAQQAATHQDQQQQQQQQQNHQTGTQQQPGSPHSQHGQHDKAPAPTYSGFLGVSPEKGLSMYYAFYEAAEGTKEKAQPGSTNPIILWLQGGPGCSSLFGMLYINGPYFINPHDLSLTPNAGSWNRLYGMLFVDQPMGVGFSAINSPDDIPKDELGVARDLFNALQSFYRMFPHFQQRPVIITGESYAGKYVPSIAHYIYQMDAIVSGKAREVDHPRPIPADEIQDPLFKLGGIAIGNGWTDAITQTLVQADVAWAFGLIDLAKKRVVEAMQNEVVDLVYSKQWKAARRKSDAINAVIANASWTATLEDVRRSVGYDADDLASVYLNQDHVKEALKVPRNATWVSCSPEVDEKLAGDVMKSVKNLVRDLLVHCPVLLYQGQFDAECGVASNDAWVSTMTWEGHMEWVQTERRRWDVNGRVVGFWKQVGRLSNVVLRNVGHMAPHDNPLVGQLMIEKWIETTVRGGNYTRDAEVTPEQERAMANQDQGQDANPSPWSRRRANLA